MWEVRRADPVLTAPRRGQKAGTGSSFCPKWWLMPGPCQKGQTCVCCCAVPLTLVHGGADGAEAAAACWDGSLVLGSTAVHRGSFQLCPDTQGLLASPENLLHVPCLGDWMPGFSLETVVRDTAPPSITFAQQKDQEDRCWRVTGGSILPRTSPSVSF